MHGHQLLQFRIPRWEQVNFFTVPRGRSANRFCYALFFTINNLFSGKIPVKHRCGAGHEEKTRYFFQNYINVEATNCAECSHERLYKVKPASLPHQPSSSRII